VASDEPKLDPEPHAQNDAEGDLELDETETENVKGGIGHGGMGVGVTGPKGGG
jgi:hypothetical protein